MRLERGGLKNGGGKSRGFETRRRELELRFSRPEVEEGVRSRGEEGKGRATARGKNRGVLAKLWGALEPTVGAQGTVAHARAVGVAMTALAARAARVE